VLEISLPLIAAASSEDGELADVIGSAADALALIMQPDPIDAAATAEAARKKDLPGLARLAYIRWAEGRCAQLLHIGPYAAEAPSIAALHEAIAEAGYRPRGRHHEIYLGDPRRSAPEKLRTIIRHPVEPV
jgi:hypothetical protein